MSNFLLNILSQIIATLSTNKIEKTFSNVFGDNFEGKGLKSNETVYINFIDKVNEYKINNTSELYQLIMQPEFKNYFTEEKFYNNNFSRRLDYIMYLINQGSVNISKEKLASFLGYPSVNKINEYYLSPYVQPTFEQEEFIANELGIKVDWMKFQNNNFDKSCPFKITVSLEEMFNSKGKWLFAISKANEPYVLLTKKINKYKYLTYFPYYPFFSKVGNTGKLQLLELYKILNKIRQEDNTALLQTAFLSKEQLWAISDGKYYAGIIAREIKKSGISYILEDYLDLSLDDYSREKYKRAYGDDFVEVKKLLNEKI